VGSCLLSGRREKEEFHSLDSPTSLGFLVVVIPTCHFRYANPNSKDLTFNLLFLYVALSHIALARDVLLTHFHPKTSLSSLLRPFQSITMPFFLQISIRDLSHFLKIQYFILSWIRVISIKFFIQ
jgi:hypothetical protein